MTNQFKDLKNLNPVLLEDEYVFCTFLSSIYGDHSKLNPIASFNEKEGLTLVVKKEIAKFLCGHSDYDEQRKQLSSGRISWLLEISISVTSTGCSRGYVLLLQLMKAILVSKRRKYFIGID